MYQITTEAEFDAAHFLYGYHGKCSNIHGHQWKVMISIAGKALQEEDQLRGMVEDFGNIKSDLKALSDYLDHSLIYEIGSLKDTTVSALKEEGFRLVEVSFRPTAENFAKYFFEKIKASGYPVVLSEVYETPTNKASYCED